MIAAVAVREPLWAPLEAPMIVVAIPSHGTACRIGCPQPEKLEQVCPRLGLSAGLDKLGTRAYHVLVPDASSSASAAETMEQLCRFGL